MVEALPRAIRLKLQQALAQWQRWREGPGEIPVAVALLADGISNTSIQVKSRADSWVVRIDGANPMQLGLNRNAEWRCLELANQHGLAPAPAYRNPELGVLVTRYLPRDATAVDRPGELEATAQLLRSVHQLPAIKFRLDPVERAHRYAQQCAGQPSVEFLNTCEQLRESAAEPVLCHNDLLRSNRLFSGGRLIALDWEYAAMGDPLFDLAVVIEGDELAEAAAATLLEHWLQRSPFKSEQQRLNQQRIVYRELGRLWGEAYARITNK